jgi:hypothetical protein
MMLAVIEQCAAHTPQTELSTTGRYRQALNCLGGFSSDVNHLQLGPISHAVAGGLDSAAQIDLFVVEKELFIELPNFFEH